MQLYSKQYQLTLFAGLFILVSAFSCAAFRAPYQTHGGVRYTLYEDNRFSKVEKGKDGRLMYDSPELTMSTENGRIYVNGVDCGPVKPGDHVEVTDTQMVLVNKERRGDITTGAAENRERIKQSKFEVESKL
ncbi:hypothetical protein SH668x_001492 [Planctomicrobium sp. SH668]|uniref:hypothetical protein n=1 Tax=Planctomicrobium sp. SH668 TaxID=3448126 RepID=UPI003F5BCA4A